MIKWYYEQMDMFTYWIEIKDEYGNKLYSESTISAPAMAILKEILTDYIFAREIDRTDRIFNYDELSEDDKMDLRTLVIHKLEDAE